MSSKTIKNLCSKIQLLILLLAFTSCAHLHSSQGVDTSKVASSRVVKVCEGIYRGPRLRDLNELKSLGIRTILNLENNPEAISWEEAAAKKLGIEIIKMPMSEITRPSPVALRKAVKILEDSGLQPVYVHCRRGRDRTGLVVASYKILHDGWTVDRAYHEAIDNGHSSWFYNLILRWEKSLRELAAQRPGVATPPGTFSIQLPASFGSREKFLSATLPSYF